MILNYDNELDKKLSEFFSQEIIENINEKTLEYFGINITEDTNTDFVFKLYYEHDYSREQYQGYNKTTLVNYLDDNNKISALNMIHDEFNKDKTRFDIRLMDRNNGNLEEIFGWLKENVKFWDKYKDEIIKISQMKSISDENYKYASLYYIGFINDNNEIKVLKCHWICKNDTEGFNDEYYLNFIQDTEIEALKEILPIIKKALIHCGGNILTLGIDYNEDCPEKHKIYIALPTNPYDGLCETYAQYPEIVTKIRKIQEWAKVHPELYCPGFALGKSIKNGLTINVYFKYI